MSLSLFQRLPLLLHLLHGLFVLLAHLLLNLLRLLPLAAGAPGTATGCVSVWAERPASLATMNKAMRRPIKPKAMRMEEIAVRNQA